MEDEKNPFSQRLREVMTALNMTSQDFANGCNINRGTLMNIIGKRRVIPSAKLLALIVETYGISSDYMMFGTKPMFRYEQAESPSKAFVLPIAMVAEGKTNTKTGEVLVLNELISSDTKFAVRYSKQQIVCCGSEMIVSNRILRCTEEYLIAVKGELFLAKWNDGYFSIVGSEKENIIVSKVDYAYRVTCYLRIE